MPEPSPSSQSSDAPERLLLCLDPNHLGEFYYPLAPGEQPGCPYDGSHPVRVYRVEQCRLCGAPSCIPRDEITDEMVERGADAAMLFRIRTGGSAYVRNIDRDLARAVLEAALADATPSFRRSTEEDSRG